MFRFHRARWLFYLLCLFSFVLLNGCATKGHRDGPPPYDVDVSRIPDAVPKNEPRSKYGNLAAYRVYGKYYYTMNSSKNYQEKGIASWYGSKFHAQRTSSGERYNMLSMTAAHKTLPLPTYVQVTNLANGKKVVVKVNDRGPFAANRIIDLSYVAAKKLGMLGHGTAYVDVKAIDPNHMPSDSIFVAHNTNTYHPQPAPQRFAMAASHSKSPVYLQVGAFRSRAYAEKLKVRLRLLVSSHPIVITKMASRSKQLYRVEIGPIRDLKMADSITRRLKAKGISSERKTIV